MTFDDIAKTLIRHGLTTEGMVAACHPLMPAVSPDYVARRLMELERERDELAQAQRCCMRDDTACEPTLGVLAENERLAAEVEAERRAVSAERAIAAHAVRERDEARAELAKLRAVLRAMIDATFWGGWTLQRVTERARGVLGGDMVRQTLAPHPDVIFATLDQAPPKGGE